MLFEIDSGKSALKKVSSIWNPKELELEKFIIDKDDSDFKNNPLRLDEDIFGEPLLLLGNQISTDVNKRSDILAIDRAGNGVVIELKRDSGRLGVETQALQYLADFSKYYGESFLLRFCKGDQREILLSFIDESVSLESINSQSRIILVARRFDETLFSMGEWLSSKGVAFRCISYHPVQIPEIGKRYISFSVEFDRAPASLFRISFSSKLRGEAIFWHNIGVVDESWWDYIKKNNEISTSFSNELDDEGYRILNRYQDGDRIIAYAKGFGAVGWGVINNPKYHLVERGSVDDILGGKHLHRLSIIWKAVAGNLSEGLQAKDVRDNFDIYHPIQTSSKIKIKDGEKLISALTKKFKNNSHFPA